MRPCTYAWPWGEADQDPLLIGRAMTSGPNPTAHLEGVGGYFFMASSRLSTTTKRAGAVALAFAAGSTGLIAATTGSASAAGSLNLGAVRACESGGNYSTNTGNGFYGAYQFDQQTWSGLGYSGSPSSASPATQDAAAQKLYSQRGTSPWPVCGRSTSGGSASNTVQHSSRSTSRSAVTPTTTSSKAAPSQKSTVQRSSIVLSTALHAQKRGDVKRAQTLLNENGAHLQVDGYFGALTEAATKAFQADKGLSADGEIGPLTNSALRG
jgi:peptidoglycan hydrolase-like protein with peptidoglycan-binding domain